MAPAKVFINKLIYYKVIVLKVFVYLRSRQYYKFNNESLFVENAADDF